MNPTKIDLRHTLKQARLAVSPDDREQDSTAIAARLWQVIDWSEVKTLHCYEPIDRLGEVDIYDFTVALRMEYPDIRIFTSRLIFDDWHIMDIDVAEPVAEPPQFDAILVPMLGFDDTLHRIGYGGGYYDQFLATQSQARKIGVCFDIGHLDQFPVEPHDVPLDVIITDEEIYSL